MLPLLAALAPRFDRVRLVTLGEMDPVRTSIGWDDSVPDVIERVHAPTVSSRATILNETKSSHDLNLLQGLKPVGWQWQVQRTLVASSASIVVMSELHWPAADVVRRLALELRETLLARYWARRAIGLLAFGDEAAMHYAARGFPQGKVYPFAYTPALSRALPAVSAESEVPVIAVAAKLAPYKGIDVLVRALGLLRKRSWRLKVAGDGPMRCELEDIARSEGVADRIDWLGWQSAEKVPQIFADAALTVLPSRFEGWGAVVNESFGVGTPAVVSRGAGAHCLVRSAALGEVVPANDAHSMASAIARQLDSPTAPRREAIRAWSRRTISPAAAAKYFMDCITGEQTLPPWRAADVEFL